jgi:hypothetical protein
MRDLHGLSDAIQRSIEADSGSRDNSLEQKMTELEAFAQSQGIQKLDDDFKAVSKAAKELGRAPAFGSMNKLLSKLAHPTAWAIHTVASVEADEGFRLMFLGDGVGFAINSLIGIRKFVREYYPEIAMTKDDAMELKAKVRPKGRVLGSAKGEFTVPDDFIDPAQGDRRPVLVNKSS